MGFSYGIQRVTLLLMVILMVICTCVSSSDLTEDRKECQDKLISLSPCLPFVSGDSKKAPTPQCCTQLRNGINKTRRCLCVLVKDRNEPGLGFKVNATLALILPSVCHAPSNASDCPVLTGEHVGCDNPTWSVIIRASIASCRILSACDVGVLVCFKSVYHEVELQEHVLLNLAPRGKRWIGKVSLSLSFLIITLVCI